MYRISTTIKMSLAILYSNTSTIPSTKPSIQYLDTNSKFRRLQNIIKICQTWKFDKKVSI